jgi:hypothetical protein
VHLNLSGVSADNPFVTFYDIHGRKGELVFFYSVPDTTGDDFLLCNEMKLKSLLSILWIGYILLNYVLSVAMRNIFLAIEKYFMAMFLCKKESCL